MMNTKYSEIIKEPVTPDGKVGFDQFNQFSIVYEEDGDKISYTHILDARPYICPICKRGWENTHQSISDQYADPFKEGKIVIYHKTCFVGYLTLRNYYHWRSIFINFGVRFDIKEIPSQYRSGWETPWYEIQLTDYPYIFTVGERKRVNNIEVAPIEYETVVKLLEIFKDEYVTKQIVKTNGFYIHSWTEEKDKEYIKKMAGALEIKPYHETHLQKV